MPLFIFFVNKPLTIIGYLGFLFLFAVVSLTQAHIAPFLISFIALTLAFSIWYPVFLAYRYLLNDKLSNEVRIRGIELSALKQPLRLVLVCHIIAICLALLAGIEYLPYIVIPSIILLFYSIISYKIFEQYALAKLASLALKQNINLHDLNPNSLYQDIRELLVKKLID